MVSVRLRSRALKWVLPFDLDVAFGQVAGEEPGCTGPPFSDTEINRDTIASSLAFTLLVHVDCQASPANTNILQAAQ